VRIGFNPEESPRAPRAAPRRRPRFTVVLPVRNGGRYLAACVESVLAQSWGDLALEVLENASTDGSAEWLRGVRDPRVRVWPAARPLPIEENWRRAVGLEKGEYLLFIGHDDTLDPGYLAIVDALVRRCPDAALYTTHFRLIDADGRVLRACRPIPARETRAELLASRLASRRDMTGMGVVMRSAAHDAAGGMPAFDGLAYADDALWLELLGSSWKATAPDEAYSYRVHPGSVFHSLAWRPAVTAMERYAAFVESRGETGADVRDAWRAHGSAFLERRYRAILLAAMLGNGDGRRGLGAGELEEILASLDRLCPPAGRRLRRRWWLRVAARAGASPVGAPLLATWRAYWRARRPWR
jgi:glycosyltransferase involved in cell wall biosynthesis